MENDVLCVKSVVQDLQKFATKENELSSLRTLNEIISSSQEEIEYLCNSDGVDLILSLLESDNKLETICIKILTNASKRNKKFRTKLLENNVFNLLTMKLKSKTCFSDIDLMLYSALIVVLLHGNYEAQNQLRTSGCLSSLLNILNRILDETDRKPLPSRNTELLIYTIIASNKKPRHTINQTEVGWITPKVLEFLEKQTIYSGSDKLQIIKCFWFFLKTILDRNELNQQIFLNYSGLSVLFRSIQGIIEEGICEEMGDILVKMTGVLIKFNSNREFLYQASNYCPVVILSGLLKTCNSLVIQQTINFMDSLTREFPQALEIMKEKDIIKRMKKAKIFLLKSKMPAELCQKLWARVKIMDETEISQEEQSLSTRPQLGYYLKTGNQNFRGTASELGLLESHFCVVHEDSPINFQYNPEHSDNSSASTENMTKVQISSAFSTDKFALRRKKLRVRWMKSRKLKSENPSCSPKDSWSHFNVLGVAKRQIVHIFQTVLSFFIGNDDFNNRFFVETSVDGSCLLDSSNQYNQLISPGSISLSFTSLQKRPSTNHFQNRNISNIK